MCGIGCGEGREGIDIERGGGCGGWCLAGDIDGFSGVSGGGIRGWVIAGRRGRGGVGLLDSDFLIR